MDDEKFDKLGEIRERLEKRRNRGFITSEEREDIESVLEIVSDIRANGDTSEYTYRDVINHIKEKKEEESEKFRHSKFLSSLESSLID